MSCDLHTSLDDFSRVWKLSVQVWPHMRGMLCYIEWIWHWVDTKLRMLIYSWALSTYIQLICGFILSTKFNMVVEQGSLFDLVASIDNLFTLLVTSYLCLSIGDGMSFMRCNLHFYLHDFSTCLLTLFSPTTHEESF